MLQNLQFTPIQWIFHLIQLSSNQFLEKTKEEDLIKYRIQMEGEDQNYQENGEYFLNSTSHILKGLEKDMTVEKLFVIGKEKDLNCKHLIVTWNKSIVIRCNINTSNMIVNLLALIDPTLNYLLSFDWLKAITQCCLYQKN